MRFQNDYCVNLLFVSSLLGCNPKLDIENKQKSFVSHTIINRHISGQQLGVVCQHLEGR